MMADIYKVDSSKIVGGPGRLVVKPYDGIFPQKISEVMDLFPPYDLKPGWRDLGATTEGIKTSRSFDTDDFEVDQRGPIDTTISKWEHTLETNLAENSLENRQLALIGGMIIDSPPTLGTAVPISNAVTKGATILTLSSASTDFKEGGWLKIGSETLPLSKVAGTSLYLKEPIGSDYPANTDVSPVTELGTRRIGYGTVSDVPFMTYALISQKKDGTLYMCVICKAKVAGDEKEQTYSKEKRVLPLKLQAFPEDNLSQDENVYYEIEQVR
ncbi:MULTISPECIES: hypothetical protein [unclassified Thermoactinomyces]|uniref:hypothetical protein n=1 Tax=unclassified Thermoactinomyces TaxID=2634588 RepID=UPI001E2C7284|nr:MULTISPECIES: hypothetical protein [unclassified Thermoactinomyces]